MTLIHTSQTGYYGFSQGQVSKGWDVLAGVRGLHAVFTVFTVACFDNCKNVDDCTGLGWCWAPIIVHWRTAHCYIAPVPMKPAGYL